MKRIFLGWDRPCVQSAAKALLERSEELYSGRSLSDLTLVLPGSRAGRRLQEILVIESGGVLVPPKVLSVGELPELLIESYGPFASGIVREFAWIRALECSPDLQKKFVVNHGSDQLLSLRWLAQRFDSLLSTISSAKVSPSQVIENGEELLSDSEKERWHDFSALYELYTVELSKAGYRERNAVRAHALQSESLVEGGEIVLIGVYELSPLQRACLALSKRPITILISAPETLGDAFDEFGVPLESAWGETSPGLQLDNLHIVSRETDVGSKVAEVISRTSSHSSVEDYTVCVGDEKLVDNLEADLSVFGIPCRKPQGTALLHTDFGRMFKLFCQHLRFSSGHFESLLPLLKQPIFTDYLIRKSVIESSNQVVSNLDHLLTKHTPAYIYSKGLESHEKLQPLASALATLNELRERFDGDSSSLREWCEVIREFLIELSANIDDEFLIEAQAALSRLYSASDGIFEHIAGVEALNFFLFTLEEAAIDPDGSELAVEMLGWLEVMHDDAPKLFLTGMYEGVVPESITSDQILPHSLRERLGISTNKQRFARESYILSALSQSREELHAVIAKQDQSDNFLIPSRLLCQGERDFQARLERLYVRNASDEVILPLAAATECDLEIVAIPETVKREFTKLSVTAFRDYLLSPFLFYLKHVLRLKHQRKPEIELNPPQFGNLLHVVVESLGSEQGKSLKKSREIYELLQDSLSSELHRSLPGKLQSAPKLQVETMRERLRALSQHEEKWRGDGWVIQNVETELSGTASTLTVDGEELRITGRIDRIDRNERDGTIAVLDYKTGDDVRRPEQLHQTRDSWKDLQLPLYHEFIRQKMNLQSDEVFVGYIALDASQESGRRSLAKWTEEDYCEAFRVRDAVIREIRKGNFREPEESRYYQQEDELLLELGRLQ